MPWPRQCANCNSSDIQAGLEHIQCLRPGCGRVTDKDGNLVPLEDQYGASYSVHK